eukprot:COSAG02_NODE_530_length_20697_cov_20.103457_24_plen_78_part_00
MAPDDYFSRDNLSHARVVSVVVIDLATGVTALHAAVSLRQEKVVHTLLYESGLEPEAHQVTAPGALLPGADVCSGIT